MILKNLNDSLIEIRYISLLLVNIKSFVYSSSTYVVNFTSIKKLLKFKYYNSFQYWIGRKIDW